MTKKLKRPIAFLATFAMALSVLLYVPVGIFGGFGITASAVCEEYHEQQGLESNYDGTHSIVCFACGETIEGPYNCNFVDGVCGDCGYECTHPNGLTDGICSICGVEKCSHTPKSYYEGKAATCTENGNIEYWYCSDCGAYSFDISFSNVFNDFSRINIPATGHNYVNSVCKSCGAVRAASTEEAVSAIQSALINRQNIELNLTGSALTYITTDNFGDKAQELYNSALEHITDTSDSNYANRSQLGDYIAKSVGSFSLNASGVPDGSGGFTSLTLNYTIDYYTTAEQEQEVTNTLSGIYSTLNLSDSSLTDLEKVYKIYNWIVNNVSYDYENLNNDENKTKYTAYGALYDQKAVCQGFASLFYRMCLDNGIDCRIVTGTSKGENHAWNIVKVGEKYYYADPTWDCFVIEDAANGRQAKPGTFFYFLRGTLVNHTESAEEYITGGYDMAGEAEYLSAFKAAVVDGTATAIHLDGTELASAELAWYDVSVTDGEGCKKNVIVKGASTIVSDNGLAGMELYSGETEALHSFGEDGFCTNGCSGVYQPATLTTDKYDIDGDGKKDEVYEISNAGQLYWFAGLVNGKLDGVAQNKSANAVLTKDITVNENVLNASGELNSGTFRSWTPIGNYSNVYQGTFDGQNNTVSGLYFNKTTTNYVGLFGKISGTVKNVGVVDSYLKGNCYVGGVCGYNDGSIENCYNTGTANGESFYVGGVCGYNTNNGTIANCFNTGAVSGTDYYVGGVCGSNKGIISNCYNAGEVSGTSDNVGGVCGYNLNGITITNCYNIGEVNGIDNVGGVCGYNSKSTITNCYNTGKVTGTERYVGGVCGCNSGDSSTIINCYYLDTTATKGIGSNSGTLENVESKTVGEFGSGEVAFLLQSGQTAVNGTIPEVWGQTLTGETPENYPVLGGAKVYLTTPCPGYSNTETKEHIDANDDGTCDVCGESTDSFGAKLGGHSLSLAGNIAVKFYMELDEAVAADNDAYMQFTLPNGKTTKVFVSAATQETISEKTYHVFTCEVAAKEMTAAIIAQMFDGSGNSSIEYTYTVRDYADYILSHTESYSAETVALVKAMLNYGGYSQVHFGYNTEKLANAGIDTALPDVTAETLSAYAPQITANSAVCTFASAYLTLESETSANVKVKLADGVTAESVSVTVNGKSVNLSDCEVSGGYYILTVKNISSNQLDKMYTYTLTAGDNTASINFGALSYCHMALSSASTEADVQNMCKSLYAYNLAADAYCAA